MRNQSPVIWIFLEGIEIRRGLIYGLFLLWSHGEVVDSIHHSILSLNGCGNSSLYFIFITYKPLAFRIPHMVFSQDAVYQMVVKRCSVMPHGWSCQHDTIRNAACLVLFLDAGLHIASGIAHFKHTLMRRHSNMLIGIYGRSLCHFVSQ